MYARVDALPCHCDKTFPTGGSEKVQVSSCKRKIIREACLQGSSPVDVITSTSGLDVERFPSRPAMGQSQPSAPASLPTSIGGLTLAGYSTVFQAVPTRSAAQKQSLELPANHQEVRIQGTHIIRYNSPEAQFVCCAGTKHLQLHGVPRSLSGLHARLSRLLHFFIHPTST